MRRMPSPNPRHASRPWESKSASQHTPPGPELKDLDLDADEDLKPDQGKSMVDQPAPEVDPRSVVMELAQLICRLPAPVYQSLMTVLSQQQWREGYRVITKADWKAGRSAAARKATAAAQEDIGWLKHVFWASVKASLRTVGELRDELAVFRETIDPDLLALLRQIHEDRNHSKSRWKDVYARWLVIEPRRLPVWAKDPNSLKARYHDELKSGRLAPPRDFDAEFLTLQRSGQLLIRK